MKRILSVQLLLVFLACASARALAPTNPGDLNGDLTVNILDVSLITGCLGQNAGSCQSGRADPNNDGAVNIFDYVAISRYWGQTYSGQDLTPPTIVSSYPTGGQTLPAGTSSFTLTITTDEPATCHDGANDLPYASLPNVMSGAGTTTHTENQINRQDGRTYSRYISCQDTAGNTMSNNYALTYSIGVAGSNCGNGAIDSGEQCDGINLQGATCLSQGFASGTLACNPSTCQYDTSACVPVNNCGNGQIDSGEQCDGTNLNGQTCVTRGFNGGTLSCSGTCQFITSACTSNPPPSGTHEPAGLTPIINITFGAQVIPTSWTSAPSAQYGLNLGKAHILTNAQTVASPDGYAHRQTFGLNTVTGRGVGSDVFAKENLAGNTDGNSAHSYRIWYERGRFYFGGANGEPNFQNGGLDGFKLFGYWGGMCPGNIQATQLILWGAPPQNQRNNYSEINVTNWEGQIRWNAGCGANAQPWQNNQAHGPTFTAGQWHTYEVLLDAGDVGQANGQVTLWVDGVQIVTKTQVLRTSTASRGWYGRLWDPVYNGAAYMLTPPSSPTPQNVSQCTSVGQVVDTYWTCSNFKKNRVDYLDIDEIYVAVGQQID